MRGDIEILAYNLIQWCGVELPWVTDKLLNYPVKVQQAKEDAMSNVNKFLQKCFDKNIPKPINAFTKKASSLKYDRQPDYMKLKKMFEAGLKELMKTNSGPLEFSVEVLKDKKVLKQPSLIVISDDDTEEEEEDLPAKNYRGATKKIVSPEESSPELSPVKVNKKSSKTTESEASSSIRTITLNSDRVDKLKKLELNVELNVSFDTNLVVNLHRKQKKSETSTDMVGNSDLDSPFHASITKTAKVPEKSSKKAASAKGKLAKQR